MRWVAYVVTLTCMVCCQGCPTPAPAPPPVTPATVDGGPPACTLTNTCSCADLCAHGRALPNPKADGGVGCDWSRPTPAGASCEADCQNIQKVGIAPWDLNCRTRASTCPAVDFCP